MPVELRKRKAPAEPAPAPPTKKKSNPVKNAVSKAKAAITGKKDAPATNGSSSTGFPSVGSTIDPENFGEEIETNDGETTTFKKLLDASSGGVVLFTYPKASTPGCTTQVCLFRDDYKPLTATGFAIYGLSRDSPKANTTFKTKQNLPYPLLCDPSATLIGAIGLKKAPSGTTRGVFVVDKSGKVLAAEAGGPAATVQVVKGLLSGPNGSAQESSVPGTAAAAPPTDSSAMEGVETVAPEASSTPAIVSPVVAEPAKESQPVDDATAATVAADVADTAAKLDPPTPLPASNGDASNKVDSAEAKVAADVADTAAKLDPATPIPA